MRHVLAAWLVCTAIPGWADLPTKQSNVGDSISQASNATGLGDNPTYSWVQGTQDEVSSVFTRYSKLVESFQQEPESISGAELVGGDDNFPAQASRICSQKAKPQYVSVMLGGNDVCNRPRSNTEDPTANLYSTETWTQAIRAGLDQLTGCLPQGAKVHVISVPRVDFLYEAGHKRGFWCTSVIWPMFSVCRIVTAEGNPARRLAIGQRINEYNQILRDEVNAYHSNQNGKNPNQLQIISDWQGSIEEGHTNTSVGAYPFSRDDISGTDCFHPNVKGQQTIACMAWASNPDGAGTPAACVATP